MTAKLTLLQQDITQLQVDAIVNAANSSLLGGGGVDGAIHRAAGEQLRQYCQTLDGCLVGQAIVTPGFKLPSDHIIHTVGPVWKGGQQGEASLLASCYQNVLRLAAENGVRSLAFPAISCGVYAYPIAQACQISIATLSIELTRYPDIRKVILCAYDQEVYEAWILALSQHRIH